MSPPLPPAGAEPLPFPPPTAPAWNEAHERVESYLRAHRIAHPIVLSDLTNHIVARAWVEASGGAHDEPVTLALREADSVVTAWFARVLAGGRTPSRRLGVRGRLALALADAPGRWPTAFLASSPPPQELADAMRAAYLRAGPRPTPIKMTPRPISLGHIAAGLDWGWELFERWQLVRVVFRLVLGGTLAALLYLAFR